MPRTLLWRLLAINLLVVGIAVGVTALTIGSLANSIFANLMKEFHIQVDVMHRLFVAAMARSLVLVSLIAGGVGLLLSVILFRRVVDPVRRMMAMAERIGAGDHAARARVGASHEIGRPARAPHRRGGRAAGAGPAAQGPGGQRRARPAHASGQPPGVPGSDRRRRDAGLQRDDLVAARRGPAPGATGGGAARALALRRASAPGAVATRGHGGAGPPPG